MMKRIVNLGLIISIMIIFASFSVSAIDEDETFDDSEDDVIDFTNYDPTGEEVYTDEKPNIDIIKIDYSRSGADVTIILEVKGVIEDRGDLENEESLDLVSYILNLVTSSNEYPIIYINTECLLNEDTTGITCDKNNNKLTFSFSLDTENEKYVGLEAETLDIKGLSFYGDIFENLSDAPVANAGGPYSGDVNEEIKFTGAASSGTEPYTYEWDFGDDSTSTDQSPEHSYETKGTYTVTLTITDNKGLTATDITTVNIGELIGSNGDNGSGLTLFIVLIVIIVIAGVAFLVYIIRR